MITLLFFLIPEDQLEALCVDILMGGSDTTGAVISYAILFLCLYPDLQDRIHKQLDLHIEKDSLPTLMDRSK